MFLLILLQKLRRLMPPRYRPERHYMRGPGPKWAERHDPASPGT
jgi:hypothetical protein